MSTVTELTQKGQEQFLDAVRESQQAVVDAVGAWAQTVQGVATSVPVVPDAGALPNAEEVVDNAFDLAEKLFATQRDFARNLIAAASSAQTSSAGGKAAK